MDKSWEACSGQDPNLFMPRCQMIAPQTWILVQVNTLGWSTNVKENRGILVWRTPSGCCSLFAVSYPPPTPKIPVVCPHSDNGSVHSNECISFAEATKISWMVCPKVGTLPGTSKLLSHQLSPRAMNGRHSCSPRPARGLRHREVRQLSLGHVAHSQNPWDQGQASLLSKPLCFFHYSPLPSEK